MTTSTVLEVRHLTKRFKGKVALQDVGFTVAEGETIALVGASGSGKSTLLRNLNGLQVADSGKVRLWDTNLQSAGKLHSQVRHLRSHLGCIFQQFNLVNRLTVLENVLVGNIANVSLTRSALRWFSCQEKLEALAALERVGILDQAYKRTAWLSGGQQQRVAIARCLMQRAKIILADEPIASLDPESARKVMELLATLNRENGITIVAALHQIQMVRQYFQRAIALTDGEIAFDGPTQALDEAKLNSIYGAAAEELIFRGHGELAV
ncbi:phosphonate ABC transporter ATP-binding protein [Geitlerinema sp. PCC 9228]|uniref:phosphonate ABC transporter ATP-binding protein n=1 Tax=Geitlerinema sp. PCC 9228 TaxID=111611 RepID=UPI0008F986A0|nr:phosphonate ABC transporter ATP-binding protein [Geitlerinema sp. PCC 9228]